MAAKSPAAKKAKTAKSVKSSKTTKSKSGYTAAQNSAYRAAAGVVTRSAAQQRRQQLMTQRRITAAQTLARRRTVAIARVQAKIVRGSYAQARYGTNAQAQSFIVTRSQLRKVSSITAYLQAHYGKKTYAITGKGSVRLFKKPSVVRGQVTRNAQAATRKAATSRMAAAAGRRAASRLPSQAALKAQATAKARARSVARAKARAVAKSKANAGGKKKPRSTSKIRKAARHLRAVPDTPWITAGNDEGAENCVAVAVANSCLYLLGYRVSDSQLEYVRDDKLNVAMWKLWRYKYWWPVDLLWYRPVLLDETEPKPGDIVGFESGNGPHCGVLLPENKVVSWGEIVPLESEIEEAWTPVWKITG